jgi:hypothetical protein
VRTEDVVKQRSIIQRIGMGLRTGQRSAWGLVEWGERGGTGQIRSRIDGRGCVLRADGEFAKCVICLLCRYLMMIQG